MSVSHASAPRPGVRRSNNPYGLTPREWEIAGQFRRGFTDLEVADILFMHVATVSAYRTQIMQKLGARNDAHLTHIMSTLGDLDIDWVEIVYLDELDDDREESSDGFPSFENVISFR